MIGSTIGNAHALQDEAAAAGNSNSPSTEQYHLSAPGHPVTALSQRERSKTLLINNLKQAVADLVLTSGHAARLKNSDYLSRQLGHDYTYLANLFSEATGGTIEQYVIEL